MRRGRIRAHRGTPNCSRGGGRRQAAGKAPISATFGVFRAKGFNQWPFPSFSTHSVDKFVNNCDLFAIRRRQGRAKIGVLKK